MAKKSKDEKIIPNGGYANASSFIRMMHKFKCKTELSWMDSLPGGTWKDPEVLRNYMREQLNDK
jgi:hypothetical protein